MELAKVAIIGRPNVGKSTLLNSLAGHRISIVEPTAGVTRDRVSAVISWDERYFELIDTGGYGIIDRDELEERIEQQINQAIETADVVVFMVDVRAGLVPPDEKIARVLRKKSLDVIGVANKADTSKLFPQAGEFTKLGFGEFLCISAQNNINRAELLDEILERTRHIESSKPAEAVMKLAIVGKRNAGKSTLVNSMVGAERVIVSEKPGTTRDSIDVRLEVDGRTITVIDTAGIRKKQKIADSIEFYGYVRAQRSIRRADVVLFLIDSTLPVSQVDKKLARYINAEYKSCIIVVNKWDLAEDQALTRDYEDYLTKTLPGLKYAPIAFTTATQTKNVDNLVKLAGEIYGQAMRWIPTPKLNKAFEIIKSQRGVRPGRKARGPKIYYATQIGVNPVTIIMFVNKPMLFNENYLKSILNKLKEHLPIEEAPIRLLVKSHRK